jgi:hypothetical protein
MHLRPAAPKRDVVTIVANENWGDFGRDVPPMQGRGDVGVQNDDSHSAQATSALRCART